MKQARAWASYTRQILALLLTGWAVTLPVQSAWAQSDVDPWDVSWLPTDRSGERALDQAIDVLLEETGLNGQGQTIRENAQHHSVNPAFALAMFRKEAGFATRGTLAHSNRNPANIVATGECWGEPKGTRCKGIYGERGTDGRFGRYTTLADGIEAFFVLMEREYAGMTLHALISRACPPIECDVSAYVALMETWALEYQSLLLGAIHEQPSFEGAVLDEDESPFWRRGPDEYWHQATLGYNQHMWWTRNNQAHTENTGRWTLELEQPGTYEFYAYIPPLHATSRASRYTVFCAGQTHRVTIDQYAHRNQWVSLGRVRCTAAGDEYVELSDETGEAAFEYEIAFDAVGVRLLKSNGPAKVAPLPPTREPLAQVEPGAPQTTPDSDKPVLLERLWNIGKRLFPLCCGRGVLILVFAVLALVFWDRLPLTPLARPDAVGDRPEPQENWPEPQENRPALSEERD